MRNSRTQPQLMFKTLRQLFNLILSSNPTRSSKAISIIILAAVAQRWSQACVVQVGSSTWRAESSGRKVFRRTWYGVDKLKAHGLQWRAAGLQQLAFGNSFPAPVLSMAFDRINGLMSGRALRKQLALQLATCRYFPIVTPEIGNWPWPPTTRVKVALIARSQEAATQTSGRFTHAVCCQMKLETTYLIFSLRSSLPRIHSATDSR